MNLTCFLTFFLLIFCCKSSFCQAFPSYLFGSDTLGEYTFQSAKNISSKSISIGFSFSFGEQKADSLQIETNGLFVFNTSPPISIVPLFGLESIDSSKTLVSYQQNSTTVILHKHQIIGSPFSSVSVQLEIMRDGSLSYCFFTFPESIPSELVVDEPQLITGLVNNTTTMDPYAINVIGNENLSSTTISKGSEFQYLTRFPTNGECFRFLPK